MALLIRTIKNTTIFPVEFSIPGNDGTHPPVKLAVGDTLDLLTTLTADELLVLQAQLEGLRDRGSISVVATLDSSTLTKAYSGSSLDTEALQDNTGVVHVSSAAAPSTGQVLTATDATHATWQTPSSGGTPAGSTGAIQFNASGSFAADNSNLFWDNTNKRLGIGTAAITSSLDVVRFTSIDGATHSLRALSADNLLGDIGDPVNPNNDLVIDSTGSCTSALMARNGSSAYSTLSYNNTQSYSILALKSGRGTFDSPSQILNQDPLGGVLFGGSTGVHPIGISSAEIRAIATDDFTSSTRGTEMVFLTTTMGTATRARRLKITHDGGLQYNGLTSDPNTAESNTGKIYFNKTSQTFQVSQNGSSYIPLSTPPAGSTGDLQFNNGGSFASDTGNLFWDSTNKGLGVGTANITSSLDILKFSSRDGSTHTIRAITADTVSSSILLNQAAPIDLLVTNDKSVFCAFVTKDASTNGGGSVQNLSYGNSSGFSLKSSNGTLASPSASASGDILGQFGFGGGTGVAAFGGSSVFLEGVADETFTGSAKGASFRIKTTTSGTTTRVIRWGITGDGTEQHFGLSSAPALSASNRGRMYFDQNTETYRVSENGGSYVPLVAAGASGTFTTTDLKTVTVVNGLITSIV